MNTRSINRQYDDQFAKEGAKIGDSLKIRLPNKYTVTTGAQLNAQDTTETSTTLQVATQKHVGMNFTSADLTLSIDDFSKRFIEPAAAVLAAAMEADALQSMRKNVYQQVNNTGSATTLAKVLGAGKKLTDSLTPLQGRKALLNTQDTVDLVDGLKGLFQDQSQIAKQYREGQMGRTVNFDFAETTHLPQQTRGSGNGSYVVQTTVAAQGATTVAIQTGTGTIKEGEIVTFADVYSVHPETKVSTGVLQQFVVTADSAGGSVTLSVSPAMYTTGANQNIDAFPQSTAAMTIAGTASTNYGQSLFYHEDAFAFATADLVMPKGVDWGARDNYDGIAIRIIRDYDINNDRLPCRLDVLYGFKTLRPELACRLASN